MTWISIDQAKEAKGLRLVLTAAVPGPWGEAAKGMIHVKKIPHSRVVQQGGQPNEALRAWTGENNAPQAIYDDEAPVSRWTDILFLAERLEATPPLLPADPIERALVLGLAHELCGEQGLGWTRRLALLAPMMSLPDDHPARVMVSGMASRYGYSEAGAQAAPKRVAAIVTMFKEQLERQRAAGTRYLVGERLSALDIYWAAFAALLRPLPPEVCPMPDALRLAYGSTNDIIEDALDPALFEHRDYIYQTYLEYPLDLGPF